MTALHGYPTAMPRFTQYTPPSSVGQTTLRALLRECGRDNFVQAQFDLLERGATNVKTGLPIYFAGSLDLAKRRAISVIGTRDVSEIGRKRANRLARELIELDVVVVSGLAAGVDTQALRGALSSGGKVIAVIGTPLNKAYPAANAELQEEIYHDHLLVSQFAIGEPTYPSSFPARNRTMAALSDASVIIEASETSGTLHQAAECQRLGRWLAISKSIVDDTRLTWPKRFLSYERCIVLEDTVSLVRTVYGE